jgi:protein AFG1
MNEAEEVANNASALAGGEGYPWSRREEMKALAVTKGWCVLPPSCSS